MTVSFTSAYQLYRKPAGTYVDGVWTPSATARLEDVLLNVQPPRPEEYQRVDAQTGGQGSKGILAALGDERLEYGDVVVIDGERWQVVGREHRDAFGMSETTHYKTLLTREVAPG